jgi:hypothetical protein
VPEGRYVGVHHEDAVCCTPPFYLQPCIDESLTLALRPIRPYLGFALAITTALHSDALLPAVRYDGRPEVLRDEQAFLVPIPRVEDVAEREGLEYRDGGVRAALLNELPSERCHERRKVLAVGRVH